MSTLVQYADLRPDVVSALRALVQTDAEQELIRIGTDACEVDWDPAARYHHTQILPLVTLTMALDEGAAKARWQGVNFIQAVAECVLDRQQKQVLLHLAGYRSPGLPDFAGELFSWVARFGLDAGLVDVDPNMTAGHPDRHHAVRPALYVANPTSAIAALKKAASVRQVSTLAVMAMHNHRSTLEALKNARLQRTNLPVAVGLAAVQESGADAYHHLLRLLAAYQGW